MFGSTCSNKVRVVGNVSKTMKGRSRDYPGSLGLIRSLALIPDVMVSDQLTTFVYFGAVLLLLAFLADKKKVRAFSWAINLIAIILFAF